MKAKEIHPLAGPHNLRRFKRAQEGQIKLLSLKDKKGFLVVKLKQDLISDLLEGSSLAHTRISLQVEVKRLPELTSYIGIIFDLGNANNPVIISELISPLCGLQRNLNRSKGKLVLCSLNHEGKKTLCGYTAGKDFLIAEDTDKAVEMLSVT